MTMERLAHQLEAGFLVYRQLMADELRKAPNKDPRVLKEMHNRLRDYWGVIFTDNIQDGFKIKASELDDDFVKVAAGKYSGTLSTQLNRVSDNAFNQAYRAGLNKGWERAEAWDKAANAWGLDPARMRRWIVGAPGPTDNLYDTRMHTGGEGTLTTLIEDRARNMGEHESRTVVNLGQQAWWTKAKEDGIIAQDAQKVFVTARDELVCNVCGPLDGITVPLNKTFSGFYMPPLHINCRCEVELNFNQQIRKAAQQQQRPPEIPKPQYRAPSMPKPAYRAPVQRRTPAMPKPVEAQKPPPKPPAAKPQVKTPKPEALKLPKKFKAAQAKQPAEQRAPMQAAFPEAAQAKERAPRKTVFDADKEKKIRRKHEKGKLTRLEMERDLRKIPKVKRDRAAEKQARSEEGYGAWKRKDDKKEHTRRVFQEEIERQKKKRKDDELLNLVANQQLDDESKTVYPNRDPITVNSPQEARNKIFGRNL